MAVITIVVIGMLGLVSLVRQNIQVQNVNKNYLIASMLSQEGLELVRNVRDENWLNDAVDWKNGIVPPSGTYRIYYDEATESVVIDDTADLITDLKAKLKFINDFYTYGVGTDYSPFYRLISATDNGDYIAVSSTVEWQDRGKTYDYVSETYLYDWR